MAPGRLRPAEAGYQAWGDPSLLLTLPLVSVGVPRGETVRCISGKEETTLREHPIVGSKTQEPHRILWSPWLLDAEREKWEGRGGFASI